VLESHDDQSGSAPCMFSTVLLHLMDMLVGLFIISSCKCSGVLVPTVVSADPTAPISMLLTIQDGFLELLMHPGVSWPAGEAGITGDSVTGASRETGIRVLDCAVHRTLASTLAGSPARLHSRFIVVFPTPINVVLCRYQHGSLGLM